MLVAFNKIDLPAAREAWPAFRAAREAEGLEAVAIAASTGEGLDAFRARVAELLPVRRGARRAARAAGVVVHRIEAMGDGFASSARRTARSGCAASASSGSPPRPTSTSRSRPSGSSASWRASGIDAELRRAGVVAGDLVRIGGAELEWEPQPWEDAVTAGLARRSASSAGRSTRSTSPTSPSPRRPAMRSAWSGSVHPDRPAAAQAGPARHAGRATAWRWSRRPSPATRPSRSSTIEIDRDGPVVHGRHARGAAGAATRGGRVGRPRADPVGRGVRRAGDLARAGARPRAGARSSSRRATATRTSDPSCDRRASCPGADARVVVLDGPRMRLSASEIRGARRGRTVDALPRPGCGRGVYRRPWALHRTTGGSIDRDRPRASRHRRRGTSRAQRRRPAAPRHARRHDRRPRRRSTSPAASSSWPRTRRRPTSCCSSSRPLTTLADYFVICSGGSERQLEAIADGIISALRDEKIKPIGREGTAASHWVLHRLRVGHRPHLHAARARLLRPREALVRGADDPARAVERSARCGASGPVPSTVRVPDGS